MVTVMLDISVLVNLTPLNHLQVMLVEVHVLLVTIVQQALLLYNHVQLVSTTLFLE